MMRKCVLVTGATGLIGTALIDALIDQGYTVHGLSRGEQQHRSSAVRFFQWDTDSGKVDERCLNGVQAIIHLAGENIGAQPWSKHRKQAIYDSHVQSIRLLYRLLENREHAVNTVVSAGATGYYSHRGDELMTEDKLPANDFLGRLCLAWEQAVAEGRRLGLRTVSLRSGAVLATAGGMYPKLVKFIKTGLGAVPGTGRQWMPWVHIDDAVALYLFAMEHNGIHGVYNMVAPQQIQLKPLLHAIGNHLDKRIWLPHIPAFVLKAVLGQMSELLLSSTRVSADKIQNAGFRFTYPEINQAIASL